MLVNGIHEVRLTATDNAGRATQATTTVVVRDNLKVLPDNIRTRLEVFVAEGKTGKFVLNVYLGHVASADVQEHIKAAPAHNLVDKSLPERL